MPSKGRILAIDYGSKRIGLAISDPDQIIVFPRATLSNDVGFFDVIGKLVGEEDVKEIVVGLPLHVDHTESYQTRETRAFSEKLGEAVKIPIVLRDEKLTTFDANAKIAASDQKQLTADKDQLAAMVILEEYLGLS